MNDRPDDHHRYSDELAELIGAFGQWLDLPDPTALLVAMATVVATRGEGKPPWVIIVGPPSTAKTELIAPLAACEDVHSLSKTSVAGLLSTAKGADDVGVLARIAKSCRPGTILVRDLAALLFSHEASSSDVLNLLRDAYDGTVEREGGFGKRTAHGKFGFLGACTPAIDRHHQLMGEMGPRFLLCRTTASDPRATVAALQRRYGQGDGWRNDLARRVASHVEGITSVARALPDGPERDGLVNLAEVATKARGFVPRDDRDRTITSEPEVEGTGRLVEALQNLAAGLEAIGCSPPEVLRIITKVGLDSMPQDRRRVLDALAAQGVPMNREHLANLTGLPPTTMARVAEDLTATGLLSRSGANRASWELAPHVRTWWRAANPTPAIPGTWRDEAPSATPGLATEPGQPYGEHNDWGGDF